LKTQFVTFTIEVSARVDAYEQRDDVLTIAEVSSVMIEGVPFALASGQKELYELLEEIAAETALTKDEWHD